jgi:hypothetical protein
MLYKALCTLFDYTGDTRWQKIIHKLEILKTYTFVKSVMLQTEVLLENLQSAENAKVNDLD